jgi:Flp pilus assembly pilin Flp
MLNEAKVVRMIQAKQVKKQKGASMIEYALVVAAVAGIAALVFTSDTTTGVGKIINDNIQKAAPAA